MTGDPGQRTVQIEWGNHYPPQPPLRGGVDPAASRSHALARAAANPRAVVVSRQVVTYTTRWVAARAEPTTVLDDVEPLFDPAEAVAT